MQVKWIVNMYTNSLAIILPNMKWFHWDPTKLHHFKVPLVMLHISVITLWSTLHSRPSNGEYTPFLLRYFSYLAPLQHYAEAIQLLQELNKVLRQLSRTCSSDSTWLLLRKLWSKCKGALFDHLSDFIEYWSTFHNAWTLSYLLLTT